MRIGARAPRASAAVHTQAHQAHVLQPQPPKSVAPAAPAPQPAFTDVQACCLRSSKCCPVGVSVCGHAACPLVGPNVSFLGAFSPVSYTVRGAHVPTMPCALCLHDSSCTQHVCDVFDEIQMIVAVRARRAWTRVRTCVWVCGWVCGPMQHHIGRGVCVRARALWRAPWCTEVGTRGTLRPAGRVL